MSKRARQAKEKDPRLADLVLHSKGLGMRERMRQGNAEKAVQMGDCERKIDVV